MAYTKHHSCKRVLSTPLITPLISQMFQTELCSLLLSTQNDPVYIFPQKDLMDLIYVPTDFFQSVTLLVLIWFSKVSYDLDINFEKISYNDTSH